MNEGDLNLSFSQEEKHTNQPNMSELHLNQRRQQIDFLEKKITSIFQGIIVEEETQAITYLESLSTINLTRKECIKIWSNSKIVKTSASFYYFDTNFLREHQCITITITEQPFYTVGPGFPLATPSTVKLNTEIGHQFTTILTLENPVTKWPPHHGVSNSMDIKLTSRSSPLN